MVWRAFTRLKESLRRPRVERKGRVFLRFAPICLVIGIAGITSVMIPARMNGQETPQPPQARPAEPSENSHHRAEDELKKQEHQRIMGVIPNFNTSYNQNAAPLTAGQKFRLAFRSAIDPVTFLTAGFVAGIEQARDTFP